MSNPKHSSSSQANSVFEEVSRLVNSITGVQLGERQRTMVETRLRKRMLDLGISTEEEYAEHLRANLESESNALVSLLTTHHTYFFREFAHFETLEKKILPECIAAARAQGRRTLRIWSAACSRGQEVYSLSMFLAFHLPRLAPDMSYEILGTDIDQDSVLVASNGVYHRNEIKEVPLTFLGNHWARGTGEISDYVKAKPSIKSPCRFEVANLVSLGAAGGLKGEFDIIFCRNVFIYFSPEQISSITRQLLAKLTPQGYLFIGISETLNGLALPVSYEGPSVYSKAKPEAANSSKAPKPSSASQPMSKPLAPVVPIGAAQPKPAPLRILCVDDSPSVLALLKKILVPEQGFEVVATAANGLEAAKKLKEVRVDAVTLDIHMPEQTGLEYLLKNYGPAHPPVVMITSVSRENSDLALQCLKSGASDFVEKPALHNLTERGDEIRTKLACAVQARAIPAAARDLSLDLAFKSKPEIRDPEGSFRAVVASYSNWEKLGAFFRETSGNQPPTVIFVEGAETLLPEYAKALSSRIGAPVEVIDGSTTSLKPKGVYLADFGAAFEPILGRQASRKVSLLIYGGVSAHGCRKISGLKRPTLQILFEDPGKSLRTEPSQVAALANDVVPATSFAYMSTYFLSQ